MKCFYHTDADGKCAGFWVNKLAKHYDNYEKEFIPINYGMTFPIDTIQPDEQIFIVDYSIFPNEMEQLLKITENIIWIDHHISAINRYQDFPVKIPGLRVNGIAGCMLTYCYFSFMYIDGFLTGVEFDESMIESAPAFTKYIADYDVWKFEYEETKAFAMGLQLYDTNPNYQISSDIIWPYLYQNASRCADIVYEGKLLLKYRDNWAKDYCEHKGFETDFEEYKAYALNLAMISSDYFKSIDSDKYDLFIGFSYNGETWNYALRSDKIDVSALAMKYGGGGHKGAAGFNYEELILRKNHENIN